MQRVLEPELMDDAEQVVAYAEADFEKPHSEFIQRLKAFVNEPGFSGKALDLGCGPGDISRRFARAFPFCKIDAIDGSKPMIDYGVNSIDAELQSRLNFIHGKLPDTELPELRYHIIFSNSLLHHLPDPQVLWQVVKTYSTSGTRIAVMDLIRPDTTEMAKALIETYATKEPEILQRDFYCSLLAAFTVEEINDQMAQAGLPLTVEQISDRHVFISGIAS
ncbi:class I SAM-dependent methyltransferase [Methyloglobulus sp.]|uniref:class I SAM-dependent methyltransferase n=1 Tax=Methyloglobulus sp. TaxID=2518622 RepID=UPI0039893CBB